MTFRESIFWLHLVAGLVAGAVIVVLSANGAALADKKELVASLNPQGAARPSPGTGPKAESSTARERTSWPRTASTHFLTDPYSGAILRLDRFSDHPRPAHGRGARSQRAGPSPVSPPLQAPC